MMNLFSDNIEIDDFKSAVQLFKESRAGFLKLFNSSPVCMSMTTTTLGQRTYVRVNKVFLEKFGFEESEIIGRTSVEIGILDAQESDRVKTIISEKGKLQNDYVKCRTKKGEIVHTISSIEFMEMNNERLLVSFFVDITKIMEQQAMIEDHAAQLEAANKELEAFSYSVSHDLRAPLRAIDGYMKILEEDYSNVLDDEGKRLMKVVRNNAQKMGHLIDDLLEFARLGRRPLQTADINMDRLVREILTEIASNENHVEITVGKLLAINGDYTLIKQVMINLISNAIKYSSKKKDPKVEINSTREGNDIIYTIRDNGVGFDMAYVDKLFGVFQRLHKSSEFDGTGVGLAIVQRILNKHGGIVWAESQLEKGATFYFKIPMTLQ